MNESVCDEERDEQETKCVIDSACSGHPLHLLLSLFGKKMHCNPKEVEGHDEDEKIKKENHPGVFNGLQGKIPRPRVVGAQNHHKDEKSGHESNNATNGFAQPFFSDYLAQTVQHIRRPCQKFQGNQAEMQNF